MGRKTSGGLLGVNATRVLVRDPEALPHPGVAVGKQPFQRRPYQQTMDRGLENPTRCAVMNVVPDHRLASVLFKTVLVTPVPVRTADLLIDETMRWLPHGDLGAPAQGDTPKGEPVVNEGPLPHGDRARREDPQPKPGRHQHIEVARIGKEREHLLDVPRHPKLSF
jgi:hypothetical protein